MQLHYLPGGARVRIDTLGGWAGFVQLDVIDQHGKNAVAVLTCDQADAIGRELSAYSVAARPRNGKKPPGRITRRFAPNKWWGR